MNSCESNIMVVKAEKKIRKGPLSLVFVLFFGAHVSFFRRPPPWPQPEFLVVSPPFPTELPPYQLFHLPQKIQPLCGRDSLAADHPAWGL